MKRHLLSFALVVATLGAQAASGGVIRFVGSLVEPTCVATPLDGSTGAAQAALRLSECTANLTRASGAVVHSGQQVYSSGLREIALSERLAQLSGRVSVQEMVISYP